MEQREVNVGLNGISGTLAVGRGANDTRRRAGLLADGFYYGVFTARNIGAVLDFPWEVGT